MPKATTKTKKVSKKEEVKEEIQKDEVEEIEEIDEEAKDETVRAEDSTVDSVDIIVVKNANDNPEGKLFIRQYSRELHGDDFEALASQFCTKKPRGNIGMYLAVPSNKIGRVEVRYREKSDAELHLDKQDPNAPIVDKVRVFENKNEAVGFGASKHDASVVVSRGKSKKK